MKSLAKTNLYVMGIICLSIFLLQPVIFGAVFYVAPSGAPYSTIQAALDAAVDGDQIYVAAGTYSDVHSLPAPPDYTGPTTIHQVVYVNKAVSIIGGYDATFTDWNPEVNRTIIDAFNQGRCLVISGTDNPVIQGIVFQNGNALGQGGVIWDDAGGGIYAMGGSPVVLQCEIHQNYAGSGGGILFAYCDNFNLLHCTLTSNQCNDSGAAMFCLGSEGYVEDTHFEFNISGNMAGGVYVDYNFPSFYLNTFKSNTAGNYGGAMVLYDTGANIENNIFTDNSAGTGGAIWSSLSSGLIDSNQIINNTAENSGAGLYFQEGTHELRNNFVCSNHVTQPSGSGAGILVAAGNYNWIHNTIADNDGGDGTGMVLTDYLLEAAQVFITNQITSGQLLGSWVRAGCSLYMDHTLWYDNALDWDGTGFISPGTDVFHGNPLYVDPAGGDYHIYPSSAAHDAGMDAGIRDDIDDQIRPWDSGFDIGADEYRYVPATGVWIDMPLFVHVNDPFFIHGYLENSGSEKMGIQVYFFLDIADQYWFWPSWVSYNPPESVGIDSRTYDVPTGRTRIFVLNEFLWPDTGTTTLNGLRFWGAMVDPGTMTLVGDIDTVTWGFGL